MENMTSVVNLMKITNVATASKPKAKRRRSRHSGVGPQVQKQRCRATGSETKV